MMIHSGFDKTEHVVNVVKEKLCKGQLCRGCHAYCGETSGLGLSRPKSWLPGCLLKFWVKAVSGVCKKSCGR